MRASSAVTQFLLLSPLTTGSFSFKTRTGICFSQQQFLFSVKSAESRVDGLHNLRVEKEETVVLEAAFTVEKEAVKNVLTLFLRKQGLTNATAIRTINKSYRFINHLVSRLHIIDKTRYLVGRELPILALEIRDVLVPYLESLHEEHGDIFVDVMKNFPNPPHNKGPIFQASPTNSPLDSKKLEVSELHLSELSPSSRYLFDIGMDMYQIKEVIQKFPRSVNFRLEKKIKRVVDFLLDLGMPQSEIPSCILNLPYSCVVNPAETTIPTLLYLENLGVDRGRWVKILKMPPIMFKCKKRNLKKAIGFLYEIGLSTKDIAKVITHCPEILNFGIDTKLRPIAWYFHSMGVNVPYFLCRFPRVLCLNLEQKIKPVTEFLLDKGYSTEEIGTMAMKYGYIYSRKMMEKMKLKWEFFLTMGYPKSELVKCPRYFGYDLRKIKLRYKQMMKSGVKVDLSRMLLPTDPFSGEILEQEEDEENTLIQDS